MGIYIAFDHASLPHIGNLPNGLHTDLKFQNQAIQCCLFKPRGVKYNRVVRKEKDAVHLSNVYVTTQCITV